MVPASFSHPQAFGFAGQEFRLVGGRALFWPGENALLVADLHLEKASFFARHGQMLPPYDSRETLERIGLALHETGARRVFALGDNFHDGDGAARLEPHAAQMLAALTASLDWVWLTGNHDAEDGADLAARHGGTVLPELVLAGIVLRHHAEPGETRPEVSGHFHPKLCVEVARRRIRRPCAVIGHTASGGGRMILPAFGTLTGGMDAASPEIRSALQPADRIEAVVLAGEQVAHFAVPAATIPRHRVNRFATTGV